MLLVHQNELAAERTCSRRLRARVSLVLLHIMSFSARANTQSLCSQRDFFSLLACYYSQLKPDMKWPIDVHARALAADADVDN